jgi:hypothetical protein
MAERQPGIRTEHDERWPWCSLPEFVVHWHDEAWHELARRPGPPAGAEVSDERQAR